MNYKSAQKSSKGAPSTNVPIHCQLCTPNPVSGDQPTIWKYNAMYHIITKHGLQDDTLPVIPPEFMAQLYIRKAEEALMGISEAETKFWRQAHNIPSSDTFDAIGVRRRGRAETESSGSEISVSDQHTPKRHRPDQTIN